LGFWSRRFEGINRVDFGYELEGVRVFFLRGELGQIWGLLWGKKRGAIGGFLVGDLEGRFGAI